MIVKMKLKKMPFEEILNGEKRVELRLYDEKRSMIKTGDLLEFILEDEEGITILAKVKHLYIYRSFAELYDNIPTKKYGESGKDMRVYYSESEEDKYGVVGIEFEIDGYRSRLFSMRDEKYREFSSSLLPSVPKKTIIGVRIPDIRRYAADLVKSKNINDLLKEISQDYFEEKALRAFIIEKINDPKECIFAIDEFLPMVDNWSVCDSLNPKALKKDREELLVYIKKWLRSDREYTVRYAIKKLMDLYLDSEFLQEYPEMVAIVESDKYYVNMMRAWYFATALAKNWEQVVPYIENMKLDKWTHNKAIEKAIQSNRITKDQKEYLKGFKIK